MHPRSQMGLPRQLKVYACQAQQVQGSGQLQDMKYHPKGPGQPLVARHEAAGHLQGIRLKPTDGPLCVPGSPLQASTYVLNL